MVYGVEEHHPEHPRHVQGVVRKEGGSNMSSNWRVEGVEILPGGRETRGSWCTRQSQQSDQLEKN